MHFVATQLVSGRSWDGNPLCQNWAGAGWEGPGVETSACSRLGLAQFPPQTAACPEEQKVFALWESGDTSDQVR